MYLLAFMCCQLPSCVFHISLSTIFPDVSRWEPTPIEVVYISPEVLRGVLLRRRGRVVVVVSLYLNCSIFPFICLYYNLFSR